jgi:hypothetical protein
MDPAVTTRTWILDDDWATCTIGAAAGIIGQRSMFLVLREAVTGVRQGCAGGLRGLLGQPARRGHADPGGHCRAVSWLRWPGRRGGYCPGFHIACFLSFSLR